MLRANNENNEDTYIDVASKDHEYHCPICDGAVFLKIGNGLRRPHFAHKSSGTDGRACDGWNYDMSDWHRSWQEHFPEEWREVVVEHDGIKHRADVLIEDNKLVVEFQHSPLSPEEYQERNVFYKNCGYDIVWLFDMSEDYMDGRLVYQETDNNYLWKRPRNTFRKQEGGLLSCAPLVFWQINDKIVKLLNYDSEKHIVSTSDISKNKFYWSDFTFELWLEQYGTPQKLYKPKCPKCHLPMTIHQYSMSGDYYWGCPNYYSDKNCKERINIGILPVKIKYDNKCPFCQGRMNAHYPDIVCEKCHFKNAWRI